MQIVLALSDADGVPAWRELLLYLHRQRAGHAEEGGGLVLHQEHENDIQVRIFDLPSHSGHKGPLLWVSAQNYMGWSFVTISAAMIPTRGAQSR